MIPPQYSFYYLSKRLGRAAKRVLRQSTFPPRRYDSLYAEIGRSRAKRILEVGTNDGINAVEMARVARRHGVTNVEYFGFDLFEALDESAFRREFSIRTRSLAEVSSYLEASGVSAKLVAGDTCKTLPEAARTLGTMDVIFIDGGHSYETVLSDWTSVEPLIGEKTSVFFDDYANFGIGPVVDGIDRDKWNVDIMPTVDRFPINPSFESSSKAAEGKTTLEVRLARVRRKPAA